jgi:hypothetical protein
MPAQQVRGQAKRVHRLAIAFEGDRDNWIETGPAANTGIMSPTCATSSPRRPRHCRAACTMAEPQSRRTTVREAVRSTEGSRAFSLP